jgi:hypothetical protein
MHTLLRGIPHGQDRTAAPMREPPALCLRLSLDLNQMVSYRPEQQSGHSKQGSME